MSVLELRLAELGVEIPDEAPTPGGAYIPAVVSGRRVYTAGQLPLIGGELTVTGKVGREVSPATARECAKIATVNALAAIEAVLGSLNRVTRVVKVVGYVSSDPSFTGQPEVVDGASQLLAAIFLDAGVHARSAVGVAVLPRDAPVEVELVVEFV